MTFPVTFPVTFNTTYGAHSSATGRGTLTAGTHSISSGVTFPFTFPAPFSYADAMNCPISGRGALTAQVYSAFRSFTGRGALTATAYSTTRPITGRGALTARAYSTTRPITGRGALTAGIYSISAGVTFPFTFPAPFGNASATNCRISGRGVLTAHAAIPGTNSSITGRGVLTTGAYPISRRARTITGSGVLTGRVYSTTRSFDAGRGVLTARVYSTTRPISGRGVLTAGVFIISGTNGSITGRGALTARVSLGENLNYFQCVGYYSDIENPNLAGSTNIPLQSVITGLVTFYPRVPRGTVIYLNDLDLTPLHDNYLYSDTAVALAPIVARILSGQLQTIDVGDTPGISLLANTQIVSDALAAAGVPGGQLFYDIQFTKIVFAEAAQTINNFAILAPTSSVTISLTDATLARFKYQGP